MADRVVVLSIPQLRRNVVTPGALASLEGLESRGGLVEFRPPFPCLAAPSFATLATGTGPFTHGIVGGSVWDRIADSIVARPFNDSLVLSPKLWERLRAARPEAKSLAWFTPNLHGASVDRAAWVDSLSGLQTNPPELAELLSARFGAYPSPRSDPTGEPLRLEASGWILKTAAAVIREVEPDLSIVRVPYLGQVARRFGPDGREAGKAVRELDGVLKSFLDAMPRDCLVIAVTESVSTPVEGPVYPNRILRELGLLALNGLPDGGVNVDTKLSAAFALADRQICQIYLNDAGQAATVAAAFSGAHAEGIATVASGPRRAALGLDHPRAGDVVLVASPNRWFHPAWWKTPDEQPSRESGLRTRLGPDLDPSHVRGSLGAVAPNADYLGVLIASSASWLGTSAQFTARELHDRLAQTLGCGQPDGHSAEASVTP
jgi:predicted AlkP superfamily pyrophosphatase or phosphodiesterase